MRDLFWIGLVAVALVAVWFLIPVPPAPVPAPSEVLFEAHAPKIVGDSEVPFAYTGEGVHSIDGQASLRVNPVTMHGTLRVELPPTDALTSFLEGARPERSIALRMALENADEIWTDRPVNGSSGIGESRLPSTFARYAASGAFDLLLDDVQTSSGQIGFWSVADALRQSDGSIRKQGLVFSPLLRDQTGFSNPNQMELTLLIYAFQGSPDVLLHLVFPDVQLIGPEIP